MDQCDEFDACWPLELYALYFLWKLQDIANTVGNLKEDDIILGFWHYCEPYIKAKLAETGFDPVKVPLQEMKGKITM